MHPNIKVMKRARKVVVHVDKEGGALAMNEEIDENHTGQNVLLLHS